MNEAPYNVIRRPEQIAIMIVSIAVMVLYGTICSKLWISKGADTVILSMLTENIAQSGKPLSAMSSSVLTAFPLWSMPAEEVCAHSLNPPLDSPMNHFRHVHTYFILYLLAPFARVFPTSVVLGAATSISFVLLLTLAYVLLRKSGISPVVAVLFCIATAVHPAWSISILGQPYSDRFFLGLGMLLLFFLSTRKDISLGILISNGAVHQCK